MAGGSGGGGEGDCEELSTITILRPDGGKRPEVERTLTITKTGVLRTDDVVKICMI